MFQAGSKHIKGTFFLAVVGSEMGTVVISGSNAMIYWAEQQRGSL